MKLATVSIGVLLAASLLTAGCGGGEAQSAGDVPTAESTTEPELGDVKDYRVWMTRGEHLFAVMREDRAVPDLDIGEMQLAVQQLLEGPNPAEAAADVGTAIPAGTQLRGIRIVGWEDTATVDLTSEYESGGGSASMLARLAQVVYTLTEFPRVKRVSFELDGEPVDVFSGEGLLLEEPVGRTQYAELLPPILVTSSLFGERVSSPIEVAGTANVFEANVTGRVLDQNGTELVSRFTTATCGTGCRGRFSMELPYQVAVDQPGTVVLSDDDADGDGKPSFEVRIPVTLTQS